MASRQVRISEEAYALLSRMASQDGVSLSEMLGRLLNRERRRRFIEAGNEAYATLHADPERRAAWAEEIEPWETTLTDGLEDAPASATHADESTSAG